jgi:iron complex outermembrane receptor protein
MTKNAANNLISIALCLFLTSICNSAKAQQSTQESQEPQFASENVLEEIVVTARKREENLQDTPISITAISGDMLRPQQLESLETIAAITPNLEFDYTSNFSGANSASAYIRGIGQIDFTMTTEPGVGIYLDGVYISQTIGSVLNLIDIEAIEVLRGPQGTLFGRNTIGGAIAVMSKLPDESFHGDVEIVTGKYGRIDGKATLNIPLSDSVYLNTSVGSYNRDGFVDAPNPPNENELGDVNQDVGRIALRFIPNDRFEANFSADYTRQRQNGIPHVLSQTFEGTSLEALAAAMAVTPPPGPLPPPGFVDLHNLLASVPFGEQGGIAGLTPGVVPNPQFGQPTITQANIQNPSDKHLKNFSALDLSSDSDVWGVGLTMEFDLGWADIKSITSYREMEARTGYDADSLAVNVNSLVDDFIVDQFSQEIQLSGIALDGRMNWLVGIYGFREDGVNLDDVEFISVHILSGAEIDNHSSAVFAQFTYDLTDQFSITGGLRYTDESKKYILDDKCHTLPNGPDTLFDGSLVTCAKLQTVINPKFLNVGFLSTVNPFPLIDLATGMIINPNDLPLEDARLCCVPISDADGNVVGLVTGLTTGQEVLPRGISRKKFDDLSPHVSLAYRWTDNLMTYLSYSEGFKSGGFVQRVFPPKTGVTPSFEPENVKAFELGLKWIGFGEKVSFNAAAFHTLYDDLQVQINDGIAPVTRNAADAKIDGFEFEITAMPTAGWLLQASIGYLDARYDELADKFNFDGLDLRQLTEDSKFVNAPEWSTNLGMQYTHYRSNGAELTTRVDWSYRSEVYEDAYNYPFLVQDDLHLLNASVNYVSASDQWELSLFGKNITDERYFVSGFTNGLVQQTGTVNLGRPFEWGLSFLYHFGE